VAWKTAVEGDGWSSPVVANGRVWLTTAVTHDATGGTSLRVLAFDVASGDPVVDTEVFSIDDIAAPNPKNSLASPTPVVSGDRVYVHFGAYGTAGLTTMGELIWSTRFPYDSQHGNGGSPILYEDLLILSCDGYDTAFVVALDSGTGEIRWQAPRPNPISQAYSTPLLITVGDRDVLISIGAFRTSALDPVTGEELWRVGYPEGFSNVPAPAFSRDHGLVFITTGFQQPALLAVRVDGDGDVTPTHVAWRLGRGVPHTSSPLVVGDELYVVGDTGIVTCVDVETGKRRWRDRLWGNYAASPVYADGRIYFQSEEGLTTVIEPGTVFREVVRNELDGRTLASLAVSDGSLFIRSDTHLYRIAESGE
jgi:outer membrane protein assembly factor BamB